MYHISIAINMLYLITIYNILNYYISYEFFVVNGLGYYNAFFQIMYMHSKTNADGVGVLKFVSLKRL